MNIRTRMKRFAVLAAAYLLIAPFAHAQTGTVAVDGLGNFLLQIIYFIDRYLVPIIFALAFLVFIWGVFQYFIAGGANEEKRQEGQKFVMYGLIGFFLMLSIWGILNLLISSFGFGSNSRPALPTFGSPAATTNTQPSNESPTILPSTDIQTNVPGLQQTGLPNCDSSGNCTP